MKSRSLTAPILVNLFIIINFYFRLITAQNPFQGFLCKHFIISPFLLDLLIASLNLILIISDIKMLFLLY
jgi:hypothetical protein